MLFIDERNFKAKCKLAINGNNRPLGIMQKGCCPAMFKVDELYNFYIRNNMFINSAGEIVTNFECTILDGSLDSYDNDCGIYFYDVNTLNMFFSIVEKPDDN